MPQKPTPEQEPIRVLFVCMGNICRSPMAEAIFRKLVEEAGLGHRFEIDSAGIGSWHVGDPPHRGARAVLQKHNISADGQRARQIRPRDLTHFDYIVAMDRDNLRDLEAMARRYGITGRLLLLLDLADTQVTNGQRDVPDPYYTGNFDYAFELVHAGCQGLLDFICRERHLECAT